MKTERAHCKGPEPQPPPLPPAENHSEASSNSTDTDEVQPTDKGSKILSATGPILEEELERNHNEIETFSKRLVDMKSTQERLKSLITAKFYSQAGQLDTSSATLGPRKQPAIHPATRQFLGKRPAQGVRAPPAAATTSTAEQSKTAEVRKPVAKAACSTPTTSSISALLNSNGKRSRTASATAFSQLPETLEGGRDSKHKFKKAVVFGNVSRYLKPERSGDTDGCKFKWKIYLTLAKKESGNIEDFVERVTFYLHSSYCPNVITVSRAPFELTKRGWGEFTVRADLVFWDTRNPVKSVYHQLKFCTQESKYGVQLKQETEHVIELFREVPVGVSSSTAHPKVGEKRKASDVSEDVSHVTIAHNSSPPVKIKMEPEEPEETTKTSASDKSAGVTSANASPSNVFKTPQVAKTEPLLPGSPCSTAGSRNSLTIGMTGGISMLSSQGQPLILGTISPPVGQTVPSVNGGTTSTMVLSSGGSGVSKGKVLPAGVFSTLTTQALNQSQPRQVSLLNTVPLPPSTSAGVTVVMPPARKTGAQSASIRAQTTLPSGRFIINSGNAVLGKASSPVSSAGVSLASAAVRSVGRQLHLVQQPLSAGNGSPIILLKPGSKVLPPGTSSTGAGLMTASSSAQPSMLVLSSAMGVKQSIPIQFLSPKSVAVASSALHPSLPVVTPQSSTSSANTRRPGAFAKAVGSQGLVGGAPAVSSNVSSSAESSPVGKANSGRVPVPCGGGGGGGEGPCLSGDSDEVMIDVVSCPADESLVTSNLEAETCRGSSELPEAAASSHSSKQSGSVGESSSSGACSLQSSSQSTECSTVNSGVMVTSATSILTVSPARSVLTGAVSTTVCTTTLSRTVTSTASHAPVSPAQTVTSSSTAAAESEASVISNSASTDSTKLSTPSQSSHNPSVSSHRVAVPGCSSSVGQSNPPTTVLSSLSSSPSPLSSSPHPSTAAYMVVRGTSGTVTMVSPSSPQQVSTGIPAMRPLKVTAQGLKMVSSQPPTSIAGKVLTSGTNSALAGPKTITLTLPVAGYPGLPQAILRTPPTSQNSPNQQPVLASFQGKTFVVRRSQPTVPSASSNGSHDNLAASSLSTPAPSPVVYSGLESLRMVSGLGGSEGFKRIMGPLKKGGITEQVPEVAPLNLADYPCLESLMRASVNAHPLIQSGVDRSLHPYCAFNLAQWNSWRLAKRRAAEWERACTVVRYVKKMLGSCTDFHGESVWSTRQTVVWCRFQALSPYTQETGRGKCRAALDMKRLPPQGSLHGAVHIRDLVPPTVAAGRPDLLDACLEEDSVDSDVEIVDYIPGPSAGAAVKTEVKEEEPGAACSFQEVLSEEEWFIRDTAQQVNVKLKSVEVEKEVLSPVIERMMFAVMKQFAARLLQQSHSAALLGDISAGEVTARHVAQAASSMQATEFLASTQLQTEQVAEAESEES